VNILPILSHLGTSLCGTETPSFLYLFDLSTAPTLLYYAYIPCIIFALMLGVFVYASNSTSRVNQAFLVMNLCFIAWVVNILVQWVASYHAILYVSWHLTLVFEISLYLSMYYFVHTFFSHKPLPHWAQLLLAGALIATPLLAVTPLNITRYDIEQCQGVLGILWPTLYVLEALGIVACTTYGVHIAINAPDAHTRKHAYVITAGISLFMSVFWTANVYGETYGLYEFNLWGPVGMIVFLLCIAYLIIDDGLFNVKIIATQALVVGTGLLIGSQLFTPHSSLGLIVTTFTFVSFCGAGLFLIRSVRREIEARELLRIANSRQAEITSLITHQIRGVFTNTKAGLSTMLEGLYGDVPPQLARILNGMYASQVAGVATVETFLEAQKIESGTAQYTRSPFNLQTLIEDCFTQGTPTATARALTYTLAVEPNDYMYTGDKIYLTQVVTNLIDNALRYTQSGSVTVALARSPETITYSVSDTGVGIRPEDSSQLFTKYGHGTESRKINPASTGLGLYIVKQIVTAHGGTITYTSTYGTGTTFTVTLPITTASL
jgi:signal transduction histidine kinase